MSQKKVLFIYNPHAGRGMVRNNIPAILDVYSSYGCVLMVHATQKRMDGAEIAAEYIANGLCDHIICAGGDGTLDEVAGAVMASGKKIPVGVIPAGSTNDLGYTLGLDDDMLKAADTAMNGEPFECDIATLNGRYYTYTASFGLFSDVSYATSQKVKNVLGHLAYILNGITKLSQVKTYHVTVDTGDEVIEGDFILGLVVSSLSVGGFKGITGDDVELDDGLHELILIKAPHHLTDTGKIISEVLTGNQQSDLIVRKKVSRADFRFDVPVAWSLDGEYGGTDTEAKIQVYRKAISYMRQK